MNSSNQNQMPKYTSKACQIMSPFLRGTQAMANITSGGTAYILRENDYILTSL